MDERSRFLLAKMLGLLGSEHEGEILAAARQIKRILISQNMSFGDLVNIINGSKPLPEATTFGLKEMASAILKNADMMREHEREFVRQVLGRAVASRDYELTEKQAKWFSYLYARYGEE